MVLGILRKFPLVLMTQSGIAEKSQLRGKKIGVTRFGAQTHVALQYQLKRWGIEDVAVLQIGQGAGPAAMKAGQLDAAVVNITNASSARKAWFHELFDFMTEGPDFLTQTITTTKPFLAKNEEAVRRFVKAYIEATHLVKTDKERTLRIVPKCTRETARGALEESYARIVPSLLSVPTIRDEDVRQVLSVIGETEPSARRANPSAHYDMKYIRELEESGFIRSLQKQGK